MQLKPLFNELAKRLKKHKSYRIAMIGMEKNYPLLTKYDLEEKSRQKNHHLSTLEEICSICWENFEKARCLPCKLFEIKSNKNYLISILGGHLFHQNCLRSWLEQDTTCPICRLSLQEDTTSHPRLTTNTHDLPINNVQRRGRNHLFRFNGNRYSSWLLNFSIEINHNFPFRRARLTGVQITRMAQSVQHIFPQIPFEIILSDLQQTQSIDTTIENIIERRIHFESEQQQEEEETSESEIDETPIERDLL